jgi:hypothetical protein
VDDIFRASLAALRMVLLAFLQDEEKVRKEERTAYRSVCSIQQLIDPLELFDWGLDQ